MRWIRFSAAGRTAYGILEGDKVVEVNGDPFVGYERSGRVHDFSAVRLEVPVIPPTFYAAGKNYVAHAIKAAQAHGRAPDIPKKPDIGYRANNALIAHNEPVVIPFDATEQMKYEGELVVVIGKKAKHLSESEALGCVLGYTIGNDISERGWQYEDRTFWRSKNSDTFKPMGPWIETDVDLDKMETIVRLNGAEQLRFPTNEMVFGVATYISAITRYLTLYPGDVIWMGTDGTSPNIKPGDVVEVEISGVGTLRNPFVKGGPND